MRKIGIMAIAVAILAIVGSVSFVSAEVTSDDIQVLNKEIAARKEKIKRLEETIAKYNNEIAVRKTQASSLNNQLRILDTQVDKFNADIELTKEKIYKTELEIQQLSMSIGDKNSAMGKQKKIVAQMIKKIHDADQKNYFEIMLTYENFADFYNELKQTEIIYVDLGRSVKTLRVAKEDLESRKKQVEEKWKTLADLKNRLEDVRINLSNQIGAKQNLLIQTKSSEAKYQTLLKSLKQEYQVTEGEVRAFEDRVRKKLQQQDKITASGDVLFAWPVISRFITSYFHDSDYPYRNVFEHSGIDIRASQGTLVRAAASGYVARARVCTLASCYAYVLIIHTGSLSTLYGHLSEVIVANDQFVNKGDIIGYSGGRPGTVGAGPFVTGSHLHFEVRLNGIPVNPLGYISP